MCLHCGGASVVIGGSVLPRFVLGSLHVLFNTTISSTATSPFEL